MADDITFPVRVAAVDVGSNAIRFKAAEFADPEHYTELAYQRVPVRLGHEVFRTRELTADAMKAAVVAMSAFREQLDRLEIASYRAVATSAVRESHNGAELVQEIRRQSGIRLEMISGSEEARLVWRAVASRVDFEGERMLVVDLGGGSVEVSLATAQGIAWTESHTLGSVRLLEELGGDSTDPAAFRRLVAEYAGTMSFPDMVEGAPASALVATGGNIESLAKLAGAPVEPNGVARLPRAALHDTIERLAGLSVRQRIDELGLRPDRADVILPASIVYEKVAALAHADEILVPNVGLKDGLLFDLIEGHVEPAIYRTRRDHDIESAAVSIGRRYRFHERHARQVTRLALQLFDQIETVHGLTRADRRILLAAALLHDIGQFVSYRRHHKHSQYLIRNAELPSFSPAEQEMVALVARYHRRARPAAGHEGWDRLDEEERVRVRRLSALLRIADALDREHLSLVESLDARVQGKTLELRIRSTAGLALEKWALAKKAELFEDEFRLRTALIVD